MFSTGFSKIVVDHPRLNDGKPLVWVDLHNLVHEFKGNDDTTPNSIGPAG